MVAALVRAYRVALSLYPEAFRRRYGDEMRVDFEDALQDAQAAGAFSALGFACRQTADLCSSLLREWIVAPWSGDRGRDHRHHCRALGTRAASVGLEARAFSRVIATRSRPQPSPSGSWSSSPWWRWCR